jgi:hypothetical protein
MGAAGNYRPLGNGGIPTVGVAGILVVERHYKEQYHVH